MLLRKLEQLLADAKHQRMWGEIVIQIKDGYPILLKTTIQEKVEELPVNVTQKRMHP